MKKIFAITIFLFFITLVGSVTSFATIPMFDIVVMSTVTDTYDYEYELYYGSEGSQRAISHWWLEINCGHSSIDRESIYGYSILNEGTPDEEEIDWIMTFNYNVGQVDGYTDWVIKWDYPTGVPEIPKDPDGPIGVFGFHSTQPPVTGYWGAKDGRDPDLKTTYWDFGQTQVPLSVGNCVPEPLSMIMFGIGAIGFGVFKRFKHLG